MSARPIVTLAALALLAVGALPMRAQDLVPGIAAEVERLQQLLDAKPPADPDWKGARTASGNALVQVRAELRAARPYQALERLEAARGGLRALDLAKAAAAIAAGRGMPGFDAAWNQTRIALAAADRDAHARRWQGAPAALQALSDTAQAKSLKILAASRPYAAATSPAEGFYYLGQAGAAAEFAAFCYTLRPSAAAAAAAAEPTTAATATAKATAAAAPLPLHSVLRDLRRLQQATDAAYQPPRAQQQAGPFLVLSSSLKLTRELDEAGAYAASLYQYLDARQQFALLAPTAPTAAERAALPARIAALRARIAAAHRDASLAELFLERAAASLPAAAATPAATAATGAPRTAASQAAANKGAANQAAASPAAASPAAASPAAASPAAASPAAASPAAASPAAAPLAWAPAAAIVDQVLPAYYAALAGRAADHAVPAPAAVTVTLIRWPYT